MVVAASEEDRAVVIVVAAVDFGKKPGKRELQQWMESNFLEAAVAPDKYRKHAAAEAFAAVGGARYAAVAVAVVESHLKAKNGCPLDIAG
jgi:hypothetical protein